MTTLPIVVLWVLMWAVTYPSRAIPLLTPGLERLPPRALLYLRLVGPAVLGLDVVFAAAMAGLALGLITGRREAVAAGAGALIGVVASLVAGTQVGIIAGGLVGPLVGMAVPVPPGARQHQYADPPVPFPHEDAPFEALDVDTVARP